MEGALKRAEAYHIRLDSDFSSFCAVLHRIDYAECGQWEAKSLTFLFCLFDEKRRVLFAFSEDFDAVHFCDVFKTVFY